MIKLINPYNTNFLSELKYADLSAPSKDTEIELDLYESAMLTLPVIELQSEQLIFYLKFV